MNDLRSLYLLDPSITFLNNGSYGAVPREVFEAYQARQLELERYPTDYLAFKFKELMRGEREALAKFIGAKPENLVFVSNATTGINAVLRSLKLKETEEVLTTSHYYPAVMKTLRFAAAKNKFKFRALPLETPYADHKAFTEWFVTQISSNTKIILLDHISSASALTFPVAEICRRARELGILTVIDGAHAPGQIPLDLTAIDPDVYVGNLHKWCHAPKGVGFLYVRPTIQSAIEPLVISHGWSDEVTTSFVERHEWQGTRDYSAYLATSAALSFYHKYDWASVRERCKLQIAGAYHRLNEIPGFVPFHNGAAEWFGQMVAFRLPSSVDYKALDSRLRYEFKIDAQCGELEQTPIYRLSLQGYNTDQDLERLYGAFSVIFKKT